MSARGHQLPLWRWAPEQESTLFSTAGGKPRWSCPWVKVPAIEIPRSRKIVSNLRDVLPKLGDTRFPASRLAELLPEA
jgi:hypothetical protein